MTKTTPVGAKLVTTLLDNASAVATSESCAISPGSRVIQSVLTGSGAVSATVEWYGSNSPSTAHGVLIATSYLSGTHSDSSGDYIAAEWPYMYIKLTTISGTSASVTATVGV